MALQTTRLTEVVYVPASVGSIYSNPASTKSLVRGLLLHNTNTTSETVQIYWVPDASGSLGTATSAMRIFKLLLAADESVILEFPFSMVITDTNESVQAVTTTASKVTAIVFGDKDV